jgi:hypothetical protein
LHLNRYYILCFLLTVCYALERFPVKRLFICTQAYGGRNALLFRYIYKGRPVKISANITFLFYKEILLKYLILYYNKHNLRRQNISIRYKFTFRTKNNMLLKIAKSISKCMKTYSVFYLYNSLYNIRIRFKVYSRHVFLYCWKNCWYMYGYIYKGRPVKISANITFLLYKEILMKYLILYYNKHNLRRLRKWYGNTRDKQDGGIILNTCCYEIWRNVIVTDWNIWYYIIKGLLH